MDGTEQGRGYSRDPVVSLQENVSFSLTFWAGSVAQLPQGTGKGPCQLGSWFLALGQEEASSRDASSCLGDVFLRATWGPGWASRT